MAELGIVTHEDRYRLLLEISRIVNAQLELADVADAIAEALRPLAAIDTIVLLTVQNDRILSRSIHFSGVPRRDGETICDVAARALNISPEAMSRAAPLEKPLAGSNVEHAARLGRPLVVNHLQQAGARFAFDQKLLDFGVTAYVLCPVTVRDSLIGALVFSSREVEAFSDDEVSLLKDVSSIMATALANALAYEQIRSLKDLLQEENILLRQEIAETVEPEEMVGTSPAIRRVLEAIERVANTDSTVLICGETGTGKELVARALHRKSSRARKNLVRVNCAALPEALIASELFGHERGAFTGATQRRIGRFEMASGSTLFLDEVGEIPLEVQVSLLRVMQEREFERLGGTQTIQTDVRLIAATNRDLHQAIAEGSFRSDLFYRLNVFPIDVPPLRQRAEDIPMLVDSFIQKFSTRMGKRIRGVDRNTMDLFVNYSWPGNIRELQNVVERGVILADNGVLCVEPEALSHHPAAGTNHSSDHSPVQVNPLREQTRESIEAVLVQTRGRVSGPNGAALRLRIPASTLESKIRALGIDKHRFRSQTELLKSSSGA